MTRMTAIGVVMALVPLAAGGAACSRTRAAAETTTERPTVSVVKIARGDISQTLTLAAEFRPFQEVEVHAKTNHVFIIVEGEATFVTGGTLVGAKQTAPDQTRAASVEGGETHHLTKGDVITIPAKTPHWFKDVPTKTIAYYAINTEP